jgi:hypothetical protein
VFLCAFGRWKSDTTLCLGHQEFCPRIWIFPLQFCAPISDLLIFYFMKMTRKQCCYLFRARQTKICPLLQLREDLNCGWFMDLTGFNTQNECVTCSCSSASYSHSSEGIYVKNRRRENAFLCVGANVHKCNHFRRVRRIAKSDYKLCRVHPSVRVELGSHWADFDEIWYLSFYFSKICRENSSFITVWQE